MHLAAPRRPDAACRRDTRWRNVILAGVVLAGLTSCTRKGPPLGQLMVTILTDAPLPDYVDGIRLQAFREHNGQSTLFFDREPEERVGAGELLIPTTLAIVTNGRAGDRVRLKLLARKFGKPRVLREAVTQVPADRIVELHLPIEWLCDGSAEPGDPMFCSDPEYTCAGGRCIPQWVDSSKLPTYVGPTTPGGDAAGVADSCFDVSECFAAASVVPLAESGCSLAVPNGGLASYNLALVVKPDSGGQCLAGGNCLIAMSRGPLGWDVSGDGARVTLPPAVCAAKAGSISAIVATRRCPTKQPTQALCGAWSPFVPSPATDGGTAVDAPASNSPVCAGDGDCVSGHCAQGVCCATACNSSCYSCAIPGKEGMCLPLLEGTVDPSGMCLATPASMCGLDGTCDGSGGCRLWAAGTACGAATCTKPSSVNTSTCNGSGLCTSAKVDCSPFVCWPGGCLSACDGNSDCTTGFYCGSGRQCVPQVAVGKACRGDFMCTTGFCTDGVCCDSKCDGTCLSCAWPTAVAGKCAPVPFGNAPAADCQAPAVCGGGNACVMPPVAKLSFDNDANLGMVSPLIGTVGSGTVRAGTALMSPMFTPAARPVGVSGLALGFDGINQHVTFPYSAALDAMATSNQFTIAAWIRVPAIMPGYAWVANRAETGTTNYQAFGLGLKAGFPVVTTHFFEALGGQSIPLNTWTHLAATYDGSAFSIFVNGCAVAGNVGVGWSLLAETTGFLLGAKQDGVTTKEFFRGDMDDVLLLDRALSQADIQQITNAPSSCL